MGIHSSYQEIDIEQGVRSKRKSEQKSPSFNYLNIWRKSPSFKDVNVNLIMIKTIFVIIVMIFFSSATYLIFSNLYTSIGITIILLVGFIILFREDIFFLKNLFSFNVRGFFTFNPFKDLRFWRLKGDPTSIIIINNKDLINTGLRIFKVKIIAENVQPVLNQFIRALNNSKVPYCYQIVHSPLIDLSMENHEGYSRHQNLNSLNSYEMSIYFSVFYSVKGILNRVKLMQIQERLDYYSLAMKNNFNANFNHYKIDLLERNDLIDGLRILIVKDSSVSYKTEHHVVKKRTLSREFFVKYAACFFILGYSTFLLAYLKFSWIFIISCNLSLLAFIISLFWREILFQFRRALTSNETHIEEVNPFQKIEFLRFRRFPSSMFIYINKTLLINVKIFNLKQVLPPAFSLQGHFLSKPDKFFRAIITLNTQFSYTATMSPMDHTSFLKEGLTYLNERTRNSYQGSNSTLERNNWLDIRAGIWRTILNISLAEYRFTNSVKVEDVLELENQLIQKSTAIANAFNMNFPNYHIELLKNNNLISGFLMMSLKNKFFRLNGSHLN